MVTEEIICERVNRVLKKDKVVSTDSSVEGK